MVMSSREIVDEYGRWCLQLLPLCSPDHDCASPGKIPHLTDWQNLPAERRKTGRSPESIADEVMVKLRRGHNLGLAVPAGVVVIDADTPDAKAFLADLAPDEAPMNETANGIHVWCRQPRGLEVGNRVKLAVLGHKLDVRAFGGQAVVWPSIHPNGHPYKWIRSLPADPSALPKLPSVLADAFQKSNGGAGGRSAEDWRRLAADGVEEGSRHATLCSLAGKVFVSNLDPIVGRELLTAWNAFRCRPPLFDEEAQQILADVFTREQRKRAHR